MFDSSLFLLFFFFSTFDDRVKLVEYANRSAGIRRLYVWLKGRSERKRKIIFVSFSQKCIFWWGIVGTTGKVLVRYIWLQRKWHPILQRRRNHQARTHQWRIKRHMRYHRQSKLIFMKPHCENFSFWSRIRNWNQNMRNGPGASKELLWADACEIRWNVDSFFPSKNYGRYENYKDALFLQMGQEAF